MFIISVISTLVRNNNKPRTFYAQYIYIFNIDFSRKCFLHKFCSYSCYVKTKPSGEKSNQPHKDEIYVNEMSIPKLIEYRIIVNLFYICICYFVIFQTYNLLLFLIDKHWTKVYEQWEKIVVFCISRDNMIYYCVAFL